MDIWRNLLEHTCRIDRSGSCMVVVAGDYVDVDGEGTQPAENISCTLAAYLVVLEHVSSHNHEIDLVLSGNTPDRVYGLKPRFPHPLGSLRDVVSLHPDLPIRSV